MESSTPNKSAGKAVNDEPSILDKAQDLASPGARSLRALDCLNLFLADVRGGIGPFLAMYLLAARHWDAASIGVVMSVMSIATVAAQTPAGAIIDTTRLKRLVIVLATLCAGMGCIATTRVVNGFALASVQAVIGAAGAFLAPALAAISLGLVGYRRLAARVGRNETLNHAGMVVAAGATGLFGYLVDPNWIFYLIAALSFASAVSVLMIKPGEIDHRIARGLSKGAIGQPSSFTAVIMDRRVALFASSVTLFHFANAAMLPLAGELLAVNKTDGASLYMSACIIAAQLVMVPVAALSGMAAERWGRKPVFLIGFAVLPVRGLLYTLSAKPSFVIAVQLLDGIGAGIFGVLAVLMVADLTKGTGRFNATQGAIATAQGCGAALSNMVAGYIVNAAGYGAAFLSLAGIAVIALILFCIAVPETNRREGPGRQPLKQLRLVE